MEQKTQLTDLELLMDIQIRNHLYGDKVYHITNPTERQVKMLEDAGYETSLSIDKERLEVKLRGI